MKSLRKQRLTGKQTDCSSHPNPIHRLQSPRKVGIQTKEFRVNRSRSWRGGGGGGGAFLDYSSNAFERFAATRDYSAKKFSVQVD